MGVRERVEEALNGASGWQPELARTLASAIDEEPNASMARELRALMASIADAVPAAGRTPLDELQRRRQGRSAAAG